MGGSSSAAVPAVCSENTVSAPILVRDNPDPKRLPVIVLTGCQGLASGPYLKIVQLQVTPDDANIMAGMYETEQARVTIRSTRGDDFTEVTVKKVFALFGH